jgi:signal transduction histidine kinase
MVIADNGDGFEARADSARAGSISWPRWKGGLGLEGMQARLRPLGGTLTIRSRPGRGCWVRAQVSLSASAPAQLEGTGRIPTAREVT